MKPARPCALETDVLKALLQRATALESGELLVDHLAACEACRASADVVEAIQADARSLTEASAVPSAGAMWLRLELRRQYEAARTAERPIAAAHLLALASVAGAAVAGVLLALVWTGGPSTPGHWRDAAAIAAAMTHVGEAVTSSGPVLAAVLLCASLVPVALYVAFARE